jgi:hypothetical protein
MLGTDTDQFLENRQERDIPSPAFNVQPKRNESSPLQNSRQPEMDESYVDRYPATRLSLLTSWQLHWNEWRRDLPRDDAQTGCQAHLYALTRFPIFDTLLMRT